MTGLGVVFLPQNAPNALKGVAVAADRAGLEELWLWEDCFLEGGISAATAALAFTENLKVGIGLLPMPMHPIAVTAMEIATIEQMFPGRILPGVGAGVLDWMAQVGVRPASPLGLMREYIPTLRALLSGEEVSHTGTYVNLDKVKLDWPPASAPPIFLGTGGPKGMALAGELADGTILTGGTTLDQVRRARTLINEGRARGNRTDPHRIVVYLMAATGPNAEERMATELTRWDFNPAAEGATVTAADVSAVGDAATIAAVVQRYADAGADSVILQPTADDPDPESFVTFVAQEVRPLVAR